MKRVSHEPLVSIVGERAAHHRRALERMAISGEGPRKPYADPPIEPARVEWPTGFCLECGAEVFGEHACEAYPEVDEGSV